MNILLIDNGSRNLSPLLSKLSAHSLVTVPFTDFDFNSPNTTNTDLIILPGASQYEIKENQILFEQESEFIRKTHVPLLGICFGAELIAHTYSGTLTLLSEKVDEIREIDVLETEHTLFQNRPHLQVRESHRFGITALTPPLSPLAKSATGIEIFEHTQKPQLGMQFHPESQLHTADGEWLLESAVRYLTKT